jgi:hypothetical protein
VYHVQDPELPKPQPGMKVYYDGMGLPTKITVNGSNWVGAIRTNSSTGGGIQSISPKSNAGVGTYSYGNGNTITITSNYVLGVGWVTWYDGVGKIGDHNNILTNDDCATKYAIDNPIDGTQIALRNLENNVLGYVIKNDNGGLPNAILDIMPDKMSNTFGAKVDQYAGTGRFNGRYFHTY